MNEQSAQAYVNLIEQLLACADDEELNNILQANQELIDPQFLQVMENYATGLEQQGNNNNAAWLRNMAQQLGQYLNPQAGSIEEYQEFLSEVLQAEYESNDPAVVYPILERYQNLLDDTFAQLLQQWGRNVFSQGKPEEVATIAGVIQNLCIDISQFSLGSRANNLEIAITGYQTLLEVYTRDVFPEDWAGSQNNLGNGYANRIRGERADNLELAIVAFNLSLEVRTRDAFPEDWARTQNNLGAAYRNRIRGERADNLELAIAAFNLSLEIYTREAFPYEWARSQSNLGIAYENRIRGERADNLELAIAALNLSLEVYTRDAFPEDWARTQNNLGNAYRYRIRGERADNLELAIAALNQSLEVYIPTAFPIECLTTGRSLGDTANLIEDWETAIKGYNLAIEAVENTRLEALNPQSRQEVLSNAIDVFHSIIQVHLNLNQLNKALEYIERSKARNLIELMTQKNFKPQGVSQTTIDEYTKHGHRLRILKIRDNTIKIEKLVKRLRND